MNLVTAQRTNQQGMANLEIQVGKLADHVEEVDDHLRGVAGRESLDTRVTLLEREFQMHGTLLQRISEQVAAMPSLINELKEDVSTLKITRAIIDRVDLGRTELFKEWLRFWGPIIIATLALVVPLAKLAVDKGYFARTIQYKPDERLRNEIEADKKGERGKAVRQKLADIERTAEKGNH